MATKSQLQTMPEVDHGTSAPSTVANGKLRVNVDIRPVNDSRCVTVCGLLDRRMPRAAHGSGTLFYSVHMVHSSMVNRMEVP